MAELGGRYRSVIETSPDGVIVMDAGGTIVTANPALMRILGYEPEELIGQPLTVIMPERYRQGHRDGLQHYLATGTRKLDWRSIQLSGLDKQGCEIPLSIAFGEFEENGERLFTGILRDRSAEKKTADLLEFLARIGPALNSTQLHYDQTLAALAELAVPYLADWCAVDVLSDEGEIDRLAVAHSDPAKVSLATELQTRYPANRDADVGPPMVLRTGRSQLVEEIPESFLEALARDGEHLEIIKSLGLRSYAVVPLTAFGRVYGALTLVQAESKRRFVAADLPLLEDLGRRAGLAVHNAILFRDSLSANEKLEEQAMEMEQQSEEAQALTEELEAQTQELMTTARDLEKKSSEAELANKAKSEFLANMSHELRTPLNAIGGYVELLQMGLRGPVTDEQTTDLERIKASSNHLLGLINDILNYAKVDAGRIDYRLESIPVREVVAEAEGMVAPQMQQRGMTYETDLCGADVDIVADRDKLRQILLNLLSNALKFTPDGGTIRVYCELGTEEVRIYVSDTGGGIPEDRVEDIFEPFIQVDRGLNRLGHGVGLGLAISRSLAHGMNGDITVKSAVGVGSTFCVLLPRSS